jgi:hypothetical protein
MENITSIIQQVTEAEVKQTSCQVDRMINEDGRDPLVMLAFD